MAVLPYPLRTPLLLRALQPLGTRGLPNEAKRPAAEAERAGDRISLHQPIEHLDRVRARPIFQQRELDVPVAYCAEQTADGTTIIAEALARHVAPAQRIGLIASCRR